MGQGNVSNQSSAMGASEAYQAIAQGTTTNKTTSGTSQEIQFGTGTNIIRVATTKACYILIDDDGTDVTSSNGMLLPDGGVDYFSVRPGEYLNVIQVSEAGTFSLTEGK